jgi:hypothetical protein
LSRDENNAKLFDKEPIIMYKANPDELSHDQD